MKQVINRRKAPTHCSWLPITLLQSKYDLAQEQRETQTPGWFQGCGSTTLFFVSCPYHFLFQWNRFNSRLPYGGQGISLSLILVVSRVINTQGSFSRRAPRHGNIRLSFASQRAHLGGPLQLTYPKVENPCILVWKALVHQDLLQTLRVLGQGAQCCQEPAVP